MKAQCQDYALNSIRWLTGQCYRQTIKEQCCPYPHWRLAFGPALNLSIMDVCGILIMVQKVNRT